MPLIPDWQFIPMLNYEYARCHKPMLDWVKKLRTGKGDHSRGPPAFAGYLARWWPEFSIKHGCPDPSADTQPGHPETSQDFNRAAQRLQCWWGHSFACCQAWWTCFTISSTPTQLRTWVKRKGPVPRINRASRSITCKSAPTAEAKSVLLMTRRSDCVIPGPPLRGILSPPATSMT